MLSVPDQGEHSIASGQTTVAVCTVNETLEILLLHSTCNFILLARQCIHQSVHIMMILSVEVSTPVTAGTIHMVLLARNNTDTVVVHNLN